MNTSNIQLLIYFIGVIIIYLYLRNEEKYIEKNWSDIFIRISISLFSWCFIIMFILTYLGMHIYTIQLPKIKKPPRWL